MTEKGRDVTANTDPGLPSEEVVVPCDCEGRCEGCLGFYGPGFTCVCGRQVGDTHEDAYA